ncbi:MAG TPA: response regulator transcription factor [Anaerolineae bacterium]
MDKIRVLVADDQEIVRRGLTIIIDQQADMEMVAQAENGEEAIRLARASKPDVVLMDIKMPRVNGIQATRVITAELPTTHVIILTTYDVDDWVFEGIRAGARAYLLKETKAEALAQVIRGVIRGESQLDPAIAGKVMEEFRRMSEALPLAPSAASSTDDSVITEKLTDRETEVLALIAQGQSNRDIAAKLVLSEGTVRNYVSTIMSKLQANDRAQVIVKAVQRRMVHID